MISRFDSHLNTILKRGHLAFKEVRCNDMPPLALASSYNSLLSSALPFSCLSFSLLVVVAAKKYFSIMAPIMCSACICCYQAIDLDDIQILLNEKTEFICFVHECCLAVDKIDNHLGIGLVTDTGNKEICKLGLACCTVGLKTPTVLISGMSHCLCFKQAQSFPFDSAYVSDPVCAWCFLQLLPNVGCAVQAPTSSAMSR
jgi:hypothetical protein